jgi:hypothetical protein
VDGSTIKKVFFHCKQEIETIKTHIMEHNKYVSVKALTDVMKQKIKIFIWWIELPLHSVTVRAL